MYENSSKELHYCMKYWTKWSKSHLFILTPSGFMIKAEIAEKNAKIRLLPFMYGFCHQSIKLVHMYDVFCFRCPENLVNWMAGTCMAQSEWCFQNGLCVRCVVVFCLWRIERLLKAVEETTKWIRACWSLCRHQKRVISISPNWISYHLFLLFFFPLLFVNCCFAWPRFVWDILASGFFRQTSRSEAFIIRKSSTN